ncbi:MAG: methylenetetrahydrofolate reductase [NAD(P)H] [Thiohalomonadales bacterium]
MKSQKQFERTFSFEFFPPRSEEGAIKLADARDKLATLKPRYFSVTFGAGGSTQKGTLETVLDIRKAGYLAAPHISCIGTEKSIILDLLNTYKKNGIKHIVALRGDMPSGSHDMGDFHHASELIRFIRETTGEHFHIEVAAYPEVHPQSSSVESDIKFFKEKIDAGANSAITQFFFNADAYYRFVDDCEKIGVNVPIVPGISPITNYTNLPRFADNCGAEIPRWIRKRLVDFGDDRDSIFDFGLDVVTKLCQDLLDNGAPGLHFYTMNGAKASMALWKNLNL